MYQSISRRLAARLAAVAKRRQHTAALLIGALLTIGSSNSLAQERYVWSGVDRVIAIGDVHGAYRELVRILTAAGVVDESLAWSAGSAHLVSVGDLLDRGPDSREVMDLMMRLQREAKDSGGNVHVLLGNHELMNLIGDLRYVSDEEYADYDDASARSARESAWSAFVTASPPDSEEVEIRERFDALYPTGYFGHRDAFSINGKYGEWLLGLPALIVINDTAFVHGGLAPIVADMSLEDLNAAVGDQLVRLLGLRDALAAEGLLPVSDMRSDYRIASGLLARAEAQAAAESQSDTQTEAEDGTIAIDPGQIPSLREFLALHDSMLFSNQGPLWYRGAIYCKPIIEEAIFTTALDHLSATRVVVGHTPTDDGRVQALFDGRLIIVDTGMLASYYGGQPTALIMGHGAMQVRYASVEGAQAIDAGRRESAYGSTRKELITMLRVAEPDAAAAMQFDGPTIIRMHSNDQAFDALFIPQDRSDAMEFELAAFAIDELLGLDLLPPTVERQIGGTDGALQLIFPDAISEQERVEQQKPFGGWCDMQAQFQLMYAFDLLLANSGRNTSNLSYRDPVSNIVLTQHAEAFSTSSRLPSGLQDGAITLLAGVETALARLTGETLQYLTADWLSDRQRRALIARRDELISRFGSGD